MMPDNEKELCMNPENKSYHHEGCPYSGQCALENPVPPKYAFGIAWCGVCRLVPVDGKQFCPQCGRPVKWG